MKKDSKAETKARPAAAQPRADKPAVIGLEWRPVAGGHYLVARLADGTECKVSAADGHVPLV